MQAQQPESPDDARTDALYAGIAFEPDAGSVLEQNSDADFELPVFSEIYGAGSEPETETNNPFTTPKQLLVTAGASIVLHICVLLLVHQLVVGINPAGNDNAIQPTSVQISFRPRPTLPEPQSAEPAQPLVPEPVAEQEPLASEQQPLPTTDQPTVQTNAEQTIEDGNTESPSQAPRLLAPALLDVRDLIQNRAQNDATARIYNNTHCDERQRRTDLIDCGDEDPNAQYDFVAAEQSATVEFFAGLTFPTEDTGTPADRTTGDARTRASLDHMNGNLGANPLIRSVMGQP